MNATQIGLIGLTLTMAASAQLLARDNGSFMQRQMELAGFMQRFDSDQDGNVTRDEIEAIRAQEFEDADSDQSGGLSFEEFDALGEEKRAERLNRRLAMLDTDGDGGVSLEEFQSAYPKNAQAAAVVFAFADADENGLLDLSEIEALQKSGHKWWHFANADADNDGMVSASEFTESEPPRGRDRRRPQGEGL